MKIIVSSSNLQKKLYQALFFKFSKVCIIGDELIFYTGGKKIKILLHTSEYSGYESDFDIVKWTRIEMFLKGIPDQPITVTLGETIEIYCVAVF